MSPLERCNGAMLSERHKWLTSRCGGSMLTQRHTRPHPVCGSTQLTDATKGSPYSPECAPQKAGTRSTMGHLREVTEPVHDWGYLHNSIGGSEQQIHKRLQRNKRLQDHKRSTRPQKVNNPITLPSRVPKTQEKQAHKLELTKSPRRTQTYA